jgi:hypothetical protein
MRKLDSWGTTTWLDNGAYGYQNVRQVGLPDTSWPDVGLDPKSNARKYCELVDKKWDGKLLRKSELLKRQCVYSKICPSTSSKLRAYCRSRQELW